jgi:uncharacterized damage-inducible protein DinB
MSLTKYLLNELKQEAATTRKVLERIPLDKSDWKPHEKSMALGKLALHVAELPGWVSMTILTDELDFANFKNNRKEVTTTEQLLAIHDEHVAQAISVLEHYDGTTYDAPWTLRTGDMVHFTMPRYNVLRSMAYNHLYHHRSQLGVYLRLLNIPVPGMYGPTADDMQGK